MDYSWGQYPKVSQRLSALHWRSDRLPAFKSLLPYGQGRSYGDICLNDQGVLVSTTQLDHFISFDTHKGVLRCEAGVTLAEILRLIVPRGWFLSVTPGTKFVSIGGAIANDVHGKNHHRAGTFGCHVRQFELLRSDGRRLVCSPSENADLFRASIGGMGLTGLITWAEIQLKPIKSVWMQSETIPMKSLEHFIELSLESDQKYEYTVAWLDTSVRSSKIGRGLFMRANHKIRNDHNEHRPGRPYVAPTITVPFNAPDFLISTPLVRLFNFLYYHRGMLASGYTAHYNSFFYPLDVVHYWNRLYGRRGLQSHQSVLPTDQAATAIKAILSAMHQARLASPLTVLKLFGNQTSPGIISYPKPGINLLLDFANVGPRLDKLLQTLDNITRSFGGRINLSKDAHLTPETFNAFYPNWRELLPYLDPMFSSNLWRRVTKTS